MNEQQWMISHDPAKYWLSYHPLFCKYSYLTSMHNAPCTSCVGLGGNGYGLCYEC